MKRWVVKADGIIIGHAMSEKRALDMKFKYEYECINQDVPHSPKMEIITEEINEGDCQ